jgi:hypothetical protein
MGYKIATGLLIVAVAAASLYLTSLTPAAPLADSELDLNCGFTDDFAKFIKEKGNLTITQATPAGTLTDLTSSVLPSAAGPLLTTKWRRCP